MITTGLKPFNENNIIYAKQFHGTFDERIQSAISSLPPEGGIVDARGITGIQNANNTIKIDKSCIIYFGAVEVLFNNKENQNLFEIQADGVEIIGLGRSANKNVLNGKTKLIFLNSAGDSLNGYHFYSKGYSIIKIANMDLLGIRGTLGRRYKDEDYPLDGAGGIYIEKRNPGVVESGNAVNQIKLEDLYIQNTKASGIYIDTPILSFIRNVRISGTGSHGIFINGGTSINFDSVYITSCNLAGICLYHTTYISGINIAVEYAGIGYWFRSCNNVTFLSPGCEEMNNMGSNPWQNVDKPGQGLVTYDEDGNEVTIKDVSSDYVDIFRGHGYVLTGGDNINLTSPYATNMGHSVVYETYEKGTGQTTRTRFFKVIDGNKNSMIFNPKCNLSDDYTMMNDFDIEVDESVVNLHLFWDPKVSGTVIPSVENRFITNDKYAIAPLFWNSSTSILDTGNSILIGNEDYELVNKMSFSTKGDVKVNTLISNNPSVIFGSEDVRVTSQNTSTMIHTSNTYRILPFLKNTKFFVFNSEHTLKDSFILNISFDIDLEAGDIILANKSFVCYDVTNASPAMSMNFLGNKFTHYLVRDEIQFYISSPYKDCAVKMTTSDGSKSATFNIKKGELFVSDSYDTTGITYILDSVVPIAVYKQTDNGNDTMIIPPISVEPLVCKHGGTLRVCGYQDTAINVVRSDGTSDTYNLTSDNNYSVEVGKGNADSTSQYTGEGTKITANRPINGFCIADGDGNESTPLLNIKQLYNGFIIPNDSEFIAFGSDKFFEIVLEFPDGTRYNKNADKIDDDKGIYALRIHKDDLDVDSIPANTAVVSTAPVWAIYEDLDTDNETILYGLRN